MLTLAKLVWPDGPKVLITLVLLMLLLLVCHVLQVTGEMLLTTRVNNAKMVVLVAPKLMTVRAVMLVSHGHNLLPLNVLLTVQLLVQLLVEHLNVVQPVVLLLTRFRPVKTDGSIMESLSHVK